MTFGFDAIDKRFRPKEPLKLECVDCGETPDNVARRPGLRDEPLLCDTCATQRQIDEWGGHGK
jgi:hypothetical protein